MEKKDLIDFLDNLFVPIGFKRKGSNWVINANEINRIINLQKSQYSNSYYLNYGYIINALPLNGFVNHVDNRLASEDKIEQIKITELLDLTNSISRDTRWQELSKIINVKIITEMQSVQTEKDLMNVLKRMKYLFTIPPFVLKHFNMSFEQ